MNRCLSLILILVCAAARLEPCGAAPPPRSCDQLLAELRHGGSKERSDAAQGLGKLWEATERTVPALLDAFRLEREKSVRMSLHSALVEIGQPAVPGIVAALSAWPSERVGDLVVVLAVIGPEADAAVPELKKLLATSDVRLRQLTTFALHNIRPESLPVVQLASATTEADPRAERISGQPAHGVNPAKQGNAAVFSDDVRPLFAPPTDVPRPARKEMAAKPSTVPDEKDLKSVEPQEPPARDDHVAASDKSSPEDAAAEEPVATTPSEPVNGQPSESAPSVMAQARAVSTAAWEATGRFVTAHHAQIETLFQWLVLGYAGWMLVFWRMPVLFVESELLLQSRRTVAGRVLLFWMPLLRVALLLPWLGRSRYAISAWINARADEMVSRFWARAEVQRHAGYVAAPVRWNGELHSRLTPRDLRALGRLDNALVHIAGPSGCGKSALAVELAAQALGCGLSRLRLLPVFVPPGPDAAGAIREQIRTLLGIAADQASHFRLLLDRMEERCLLFVLDEANDPAAVNELVSALRMRTGRLVLVATSADISATVDLRLEPVAPTEDRLRTFAAAFLEQRGCGKSIADAELTAVCDHVSSLQTPEPLPMSLLTVCLDDFDRCRAENAAWRPAASLVELLNRHIDRRLALATGFGFTPDELRRDVDELVKMSTARAFQPQTLRYDAVAKRLPGATTARRLAFLEQQAQLLVVDRGLEGTVRFQNNTLALRLAAEARRETLDLAESRWTAFLHQLRTAAHSETVNVRPFATALYECCAASTVERPESVLGELGQLAGLDAEQVQRDMIEHQIEVALARLGNDDFEARRGALRRLQGLALRSVRALSTLIDVAGSDDRDDSDEATGLLTELGSPIVRSLCDRLEGEDVEPRRKVIGLIERMGPAARLALPALMQSLDDESDAVRGAAIAAIASVAPDELPPLKGMLHDASDVVRAACAMAFGTLGARAESVAGDLAALLDDPSAAARFAAAESLGQIGLASVEVASALIKSLVDEDRDVSRAAAEALARLRGRPETPTREVMRNREYRRSAALAGRAA